MPEASAPPLVLIAGAGPTGLVLALWLTRMGIAVRVVDQAPGPGTTSRALGVQARTLEFYAQLGIADTVVSAGVVVEGVNLWVKSVRAARLPFEGIGTGISPYPFVLIFPQDAHEQLLVDILARDGVTVERNTRLTGFTQDDAGVHATLAAAGGREETCDAAFLAGCDGAHSVVRELNGAGFPGGTYDHVFYVADVQARGPAINRELHIDLDRADLLAIFPMKGDGRARLVGTLGDEAVANDRQPTFDDVRDRAVHHLNLQVDTVNWFSTYRVHHRVAQTFRQRRAFLLGDAAHIHSPVGAQGMNTGIGDAINLAWKLAATLRGASPVVLDSYEPERIAFARRLVATTDRVFTLASKQGRVAAATRTIFLPMVAPLLLRLAGFRRWLFRTVSQTAIEYRDSALSAGSAGAIRGGDRLPWVGHGTDGDTFAPLRSLAWQVHVHGAATDRLKALCDELGLALHVFRWNRATHAAGFRRDALYLIRPDGYVALADAQADVDTLRRYVARTGIAAGRS